MQIVDTGPRFCVISVSALLFRNGDCCLAVSATTSLGCSLFAHRCCCSRMYQTDSIIISPSQCPLHSNAKSQGGNVFQKVATRTNPVFFFVFFFVFALCYNLVNKAWKDNMKCNQIIFFDRVKLNQCPWEIGWKQSRHFKATISKWKSNNQNLNLS